MLEVTKEDFEGKGTNFFDLYLYPFGIWKKYDGVTNRRDYNYYIWRTGVKEDEGDAFMLIKTSSHHYTLTHYRIMDGFNECKRFSTLWAACCHIMEQVKEYDRLYPEYLAVKQRAAEERKKMREEAKARKRQRNSTRKGE